MNKPKYQPKPKVPSVEIPMFEVINEESSE